MGRSARDSRGWLVGLGLAAATSACGQDPEPSPTLTTQSGAQTQMEAAREAERIFSTRCFTCHGSQGAGDGPEASGLNPAPPDLRDPIWQASVDDSHIENIIVRGGTAVGLSPLMPGNPDLATRPELVSALVAYVRSLAASAPDAGELAGATYAGVLEEPVTLSGGVWEGEPYTPGGASRPRVILAHDFRLVGDLDGDGVAEAVVLLVESSGGTGSFVYVAAVSRRDGKPVNVATAELGDRVQVRSGRIAAGRVELDVVQTGPEDAACCPSQTATRSFRLTSAGFAEERPRNIGKLSLEDLRGVEWRLTHFAGWEEPAPAEPEVTLIFTDQGVSGSSGCNRYFGAPWAGEIPGELSFGPLTGTRMACPQPVMQLEQRYLLALSAVTKFGFVAGQLALSYPDGERTKTLLFTAAHSRPAPQGYP